MAGRRETRSRLRGRFSWLSVVWKGGDPKGDRAALSYERWMRLSPDTLRNRIAEEESSPAPRPAKLARMRNWLNYLEKGNVSSPQP